MTHRRTSLPLKLAAIMLVIPILYQALWISVSTDTSKTYSEKVIFFMSYFPESFRDPFWLTFSMLAISLISASFGFSAYLRSERKGTQISGLIIAGLGGLLALLFGLTLL